jgi:hypothetical protein
MPSARPPVRVVCPWCCTEQRLKADGTFRRHPNPNLGTGADCDGCGKEPGPPRGQVEAEVKRAELRDDVAEAGHRCDGKLCDGLMHPWNHACPTCGAEPEVACSEDDTDAFHDARHAEARDAAGYTLGGLALADPEPVAGHVAASPEPVDAPRRGQEQLGLDLRPVRDVAAAGVLLERRVGVTLRFEHSHFQLAIAAAALKKLRASADAGGRQDKLKKKVKAKPDVDDIPKGARASEGKALVARALTCDIGHEVRTALEELLRAAPPGA